MINEVSSLQHQGLCMCIAYMCLVGRPPSKAFCIEFWVINCIFVTQRIKTIRIYPNPNMHSTSLI